MVLIYLILLIIILMGVGIYIAYTRLSKSAKSQCIYVTPSTTDQNLTCNCAKGMSQTDCNSRNGLYSSITSCDSTFNNICKSQLLGNCISSTNQCSYPSTKNSCNGTWNMGVECPN